MQRKGKKMFNVVRLGALVGASGILCSFGGHFLKSRLDLAVVKGRISRSASERLQAVWKQANIFHMIHAVAILCSPLSRSPNLVAFLFAFGTFLYSGGLYFFSFSLGEQKRFAPAAPIGGAVLVVGWLSCLLCQCSSLIRNFVIVLLWKTRKNSENNEKQLSSLNLRILLL